MRRLQLTALFSLVIRDPNIFDFDAIVLGPSWKVLISNFHRHVMILPVFNRDTASTSNPRMLCELKSAGVDPRCRSGNVPIGHLISALLSKAGSCEAPIFWFCRI